MGSLRDREVDNSDSDLEFRILCISPGAKGSLRTKMTPKSPHWLPNKFFVNLVLYRWYRPLLLDLSAPFDTLDHSSITNLLSTWYCIDGIALDWFVFYLSDRMQKVKLLDCLSSPAEVACGVPQGSVLDCYILSTPLAM